MKLIIAGGRDFNDYGLLCLTVTNFLKEIEDHVIEIVSGGAKGADELGEKYAREILKSSPTIFYANWKEYGKTAGPIRNMEMAKYADALVAFWDGKSKGTKNMINTAIKMSLIVKIIKYS